MRFVPLFQVDMPSTKANNPVVIFDKMTVVGGMRKLDFVVKGGKAILAGRVCFAL